MQSWKDMLRIGTAKSKNVNWRLENKNIHASIKQKEVYKKLYSLRLIYYIQTTISILLEGTVKITKNK